MKIELPPIREEEELSKLIAKWDDEHEEEMKEELEEEVQEKGFISGLMIRS